MTPSRSRIVLGLAVIAAIIGLWIVLMQPAEAHGPYELHPAELPVAEYLDAKAALWRLAADKCERLPVCPGGVQYRPDNVTVTERRSESARDSGRSVTISDYNQWRPLDSLIERYFLPKDWDWARRVAWCESRYDPNARNQQSGAAGYFQHLPRYWPDRASAAGWAGADIFDPEANVAVSAWLYYEGGGPGHWSCK